MHSSCAKFVCNMNVTVNAASHTIGAFKSFVLSRKSNNRNECTAEDYTDHIVFGAVFQINLHFKVAE